jgi:hypothetical protein
MPEAGVDKLTHRSGGWKVQEYGACQASGEGLMLHLYMADSITWRQSKCAYLGLSLLTKPPVPSWSLYPHDLI